MKNPRTPKAPWLPRVSPSFAPAETRGFRHQIGDPIVQSPPLGQAPKHFPAPRRVRALGEPHAKLPLAGVQVKVVGVGGINPRTAAIQRCSRAGSLNHTGLRTVSSARGPSIDAIGNGCPRASAHCSASRLVGPSDGEAQVAAPHATPYPWAEGQDVCSVRPGWRRAQGVNLRLPIQGFSTRRARHQPRPATSGSRAIAPVHARNGRAHRPAGSFGCSATPCTRRRLARRSCS